MTDSHWMSMALDAARLGVGKTAPNPPVGAIIVKDNAVLGTGWHRAAGKPHAEREALADAFQKVGIEAVRGSTIYITLEPCSTHGRTPPCTQGIIDAGISRVVYACVDRNPAHSGNADVLLENAGIRVTSGVLEEQAERLLKPFFKVREHGIPWLIWKCAMSLDGRITRPPSEGQWLTGVAARADVQKLRATADAIITSGETVRKDHPSLTLREPHLLEGRLQPWRIVVTDFPESMPQNAPLFQDEWKERTLLRPRNDLRQMLARLADEQGILTAIIEAGGTFSAKLFQEGLIDEVVIYYAPIICGGPSPALSGCGLNAALSLDEVEFLKLGNDVRLRGMIRR